MSQEFEGSPWLRPGRAKILGLSVALAGTILMACTNGQGTSVPFSQASCEPIAGFERYRYSAHIRLEVPEAEDPSIADSPYPPFKLVFDVDGAVQGEERREAAFSYPETNDSDLSIIVVGDQYWEFLGIWVPNPVDPLVAPIPYLPLDICRSIEPDVNVQGMTAVREEVNGIAALKYHFDSLPTEFSSRFWGPQSDMARFIKDYPVDIWLAEDGGWPVRLDFKGEGNFENGRELRVAIFVELRDINDKSINIVPPAER